MYSFNLNDKNILITGSSNGIGAAIALGVAKMGANVVINYYSSEQKAIELVNAIKNLGVSAIAIQADVSNENDVKRLLNETCSFFSGKLDVLINNAGNIFASSIVKNMELSLWEKTLNTNLTSTFLVSKYAIPLIEKSTNGKIINMSSVAACNGGGPGTTAYAASKAAIRAFSKGLAKELAPNITVNCIAPGVINTRIHQTYVSDEQRIKNLSRIPLHREGLTDDIVGAAIFLASDFSNYITGETIEINGGLYMN